MARFLVWSDLHDEFWEGFDLPELSAPVDRVLIAGDTHTMGRHLDIPARAARKYGCPVVVIWGNHEPYGSIWSESMADEERKLEKLRTEVLDIRVLHGAETEVAGVRIIGATLWTDLKLHPPFEYLARLMVSAYMQDYRAIRTASKTLLTVDYMLERHRQDKAAIFEALSKPHAGPTIVMTHHLPVRQLIEPWRTIGGNQKRARNNGFACDLWDDIKVHDIHTWVCGHSHEGENWTGAGGHGPIRFVTNQRGYPGEETEFDPTLTINVS
ncbi:serine/threonine protein phosphatase (plasmid) [Phaeobacter inhibens]|uniref:metallophosphoesterase n=1 Tax=Phaeobacter inhibens TaxID=221822 RepID=UPI0009718B8B|nr:metallophosphoesterase [Phaeobacter inhibens]APX17991.1 serine/threonine protein phosphatase [Phaeobacter inhibens]